MAVCTTRKLANVKNTNRIRCGQYQEIRRSSGKTALPFKTGAVVWGDSAAYVMGSPGRGAGGSIGWCETDVAPAGSSSLLGSSGELGSEPESAGKNSFGLSSNRVIASCRALLFARRLLPSW